VVVPTVVPPVVQFVGAEVWAKTLKVMEPPAFVPELEAKAAVIEAAGMDAPTVPTEGPATVRVGLALPTVKEPLAGVEDNPLADPMRV